METYNSLTNILNLFIYLQFSVWPTNKQVLKNFFQLDCKAVILNQNVEKGMQSISF